MDDGCIPTYAGGVIIDHAVSRVEGSQHPRLLSREQVHRFDALAPHRAFLLHFQAQRHDRM